MKKLMLTILVLMTSKSMADSGWFCTEASSKVFTNEVHACGTAVRETEATARQMALDYAISEFETICEHSDSCKGRKYDMVPERTECKQLFPDIYKCWRMAIFVLK